MSKLTKIQLPINERVVDENGFISKAWKNELLKLQQILNTLVDEYNQP